MLFVSITIFSLTPAGVSGTEKAPIQRCSHLFQIWVPQRLLPRFATARLESIPAIQTLVRAKARPWANLAATNG
jgi:hypothetical protein